MPLHSVTISVSSSADTSYIADILFELGALSVTVTDKNRGTAHEQPIFAEPPQDGLLSTTSPPVWQNAQITSLYPLTYDVEALQMLIATHFDLPTSPTFTLHTDVFDEKQPDVWVRHVQKSFQPIVIGRVRISFPWHDRMEELLDVRLEPGMAFGTGEHPTTQLCIAWLQKVVKPGFSVLDFGTGSGVLAITSVMLAEDTTAVGVDLDPTALQVALANSDMNRVSDRLGFYENDDEPPSVYDIVIANILAGPLKHLADTLVSRVKEGGQIALSGVLASQATDLIESYQRRGIVLEEGTVQDGWSLLHGVRSPL